LPAGTIVPPNCGPCCFSSTACCSNGVLCSSCSSCTCGVICVCL
jgi:hypothetical protein